MVAGAHDCRRVADEIDSRRAVMIERPRDALRLHNDDVWSSRAADVSREGLRRYVAATLYYLDLDLAATARALRDEASELDSEAAVLRRQAVAHEEAAAEEATASAATLVGADVGGDLGGGEAAIDGWWLDDSLLR